MALLVESRKLRAINKTYKTTNGFYIIMFTSEAYTLQYNTTIDGQIITAGELVVKEQYLCSMKLDTNWYCNKHPQHHVIAANSQQNQSNLIKYYFCVIVLSILLKISFKFVFTYWKSLIKSVRKNGAMFTP